MSSDVTIEIFGKVANPEAFHALALEAAAEAYVDWSEPVQEDDFVEMLVDAAADGRALVLTRSDTNNHFDAVTSACQAAGLSYVVNTGASGEEGYTDGFSWYPGMEEEFHFEVAGGEPAIPVSELRERMSHGIDALQKYVDHVEARTKVGKLEIDPGFQEAYASYLENKMSENLVP